MMATAESRGAAKHLDALDIVEIGKMFGLGEGDIHSLNSSGLADEVRRVNLATFARAYNGPNNQHYRREAQETIP